VDFGHHRLLCFKRKCHRILLAEDQTKGADRSTPTLAAASTGDAAHRSSNDRLMATFTSNY
jgi:hypothetical protein